MAAALPNVTAPGTAILSIDAETASGYTNKTGTSMATPHVAGLLAAFLSVRTEFIGYPDRVKEILLSNCTDLRRDRYAHMAIHPYPAHLVGTWQPRAGPEVTLRPIRPEDAEMEQAFVKRLSAETRYFRFMDTLRELTPQMLVRFTQIDYDREMAFIATAPHAGGVKEIGVCRYITNPDGETCEFALVVADEWHHRGLGSRMMRELIQAARERGLRSMIGHVLTENRGMLALCTRLGFVVTPGPEDPIVRRVTLTL